ncbi:MAG: hypothetical protein BZ135_00625 [Methanosphaera sp. rholeuAM6]|nr:MAG: hypothetical protein BZ135_00625 [Methanosphaera sp. rholeuAM6]
MTIHTIKGSEANEESFQEIVSKLDNYKTLASNHGVQIKETSIHSTHGILYCTLDFKKMEEHNIIELLGLDSDYIIKDKNDFYKLISKKVLNLNEVEDKFKYYVSIFFNHEINEFKISNILYKRNNELLYLDVTFSLLLEDSFLVFVDDVTTYVKDKLLLEEFAVHNEILVKEVHHRVKNNLQILLSLISIQQRFGYDEDSITDYMRLSISSMALIHNQLYGENLDYVSLKSIIEDFATNIENFYGELDVNFNFKTEGDVNLSIDKSNPLFLILNELIINSINHAFDENTAEKSINCILKEEDQNLFIQYYDNGHGLRDIQEDESGLGHVLIDSLISQVDGEYYIELENGYRMDIIMPITNVLEE